jgi:hypothetical protein
MDTSTSRVAVRLAFRIAMHSPLHFSYPIFGHFPLAFSLDQSDESSCAKQAQKRIPTHMTTEETSTTGKAAAVAAQGAHVAPERATSKKGASQKKGAPKAKKSAKEAKPGAKAKAAPAKAAAPKKGAKEGAKTSEKTAKPAAKKASAPRAESKWAKILDMIARRNGATLLEIMKATGWQAHSVRGLISTGGKKRGVKVESAKNEAGERVYRVAKVDRPIHPAAGSPPAAFFVSDAKGSSTKLDTH